MPQPHLEQEVKQADLLEIKIPGLAEHFFFQNYSREPITFRGKTYSFLNFSYTASARSLDQNNQAVQISFPNITVGDKGFAPIRDYIRKFDGLRKSVFIVTVIFPERLDASPIQERLLVASSTISSSDSTTEIIVRLQSPANAVNSKIPNIHFERSSFPELPITKSGAFS